MSIKLIPRGELMANNKILIVEDHSMLALWLEETLKDLGYEITDIAASGAEAMEKIATNIPDLILMDISIQGDIDGIQTAMKIQENYNIPIIYTTGYTEDEIIERAEKTNSYGYILKPFQEKQIHATIKIALQKHQKTLELEKSLENVNNNKNQSRYLAIASHDLRTPLSSIQTSIELLRNYNDKLTEEKKEKLLQKIQLSSLNMNQLVEDILTMYEWESGQAEFNHQPTNVKDFIENILDNLRGISSDKYEFILEIAGENQLFNLEQKLLKHILSNLLSNAVKYSPDGGKIAINVTKKAKELIFVIKDQGIGIPPEYEKKMFQEFERANNVGKIKGTGLGLSIVKQAVELYQGKISVKSQLGVGTEFTVIIPIDHDK
jgi:signal transduction histidine kinase